MSKKKKVVPGKSAKKKAEKKHGKKATKPSDKKNSAKKPTKQSKKAEPKKASKKSSKALKPKASKKTIVKKAAPAKKKPVTKPISKAPAKKAVKKAAPVKKEVKKPVKAVKTNVKPVAASKKPRVKELSKPAPKSNSKPTSPPVVKSMPVPAAEKAKKSEEPAAKKAVADNKPANVLAITNTIPVAQKHELSASRIASISHSITNPIKKTDSYAIKPEKEPNGKFEMEFVVHCSAEMLYEFLSTASGLSEWFCDDLNIRNGIYTFIWEDQLQQARLLKTVELQVVRFQWVDKTDGSYFEFKIQRDDLTNDISLIITDFAETVSERESSKLLWHSQIEKLMHVIGSIF